MTLAQKSYKPALLLLSICLLAGAFQLQRRINFHRRDLGFTRTAVLENAPPVLLFTTVALGGFRGLIANALWIRANDLQENDKFFEMVQLADWITKLEPHFVQVWLVQGWNMAYNISVKFPDPADRWRWVQRGITLLRDDGLRYNPDETLIYRELSWFFQHKMGANLDDAHMSYKQAWFQEMSDLFGGKPKFEELTNPTTPEQARRVEVLRNRYKMDPVIMQEVDQEYGPLEWRLPDAHAIYWAEVGRRRGRKDAQETLRRSIYQTMQMVFHRGALHIDSLTGDISTGPNLDAIPNVNKAYVKMMEVDPEKAHLAKTGHRNFLIRVIIDLWMFDRGSEAAEWFKYLQETYPDHEKIPPGMTVTDFAYRELTQAVTEKDVNRNASIIGAFLLQAFKAYITGDDERAALFEGKAEEVHARHQDVTTKRVALPPFEQMKRDMLTRLLDERSGLKEEARRILAQRLGIQLPPKEAPAPANPQAPTPPAAPAPSPAPK